MADILHDIDFSTPDSFSLSGPTLARAEAELHLAQACGGFLMMEAVFGAHPLLASFHVGSDFEGGYIPTIEIVAPDGSVAETRQVLSYFYHLKEENEHREATADPNSHIPTALELLLMPSETEVKAFLAFSSVSVGSIELAETAVRSVLDHLQRHARPLFSRHVVDATFFPADSPGLARSCGMHEAAALIEKSRISPPTIGSKPHGPIRI